MGRPKVDITCHYFQILGVLKVAIHSRVETDNFTICHDCLISILSNIQGINLLFSSQIHILPALLQLFDSLVWYLQCI